ncbi:universal stress protein [Persicobacter sp. CCB-QB2]|uniref:universal stress protein n=1 Tax=Persicobacter sp. CCB-QB2 TaxID=1561025 RepID=UPI0006A94E61|nr:universal stress protein [Persicobacter sp. CCB-QB2]
MIKKVLVPTDFSQQANYALTLAIEIAKRADAGLTLVHVVEMSAPNVSALGVPYMESGEQIEVARQQHDAALEKMKKIVESKQSADVAIEMAVEYGSTFSDLYTQLEGFHADMIVMGSKGAGGLEEIIIGSNAEKVVRNAKVPVLVVKNETHLRDIRSIMLARKFHDHKEDHAIEALKALQEFTGADLHLVKVNTPANFEDDRTNYAHIKAFAEKYQLERYYSKVYNAFTEEDGILFYARDNEIDLIALASSGGSIMQSIFGSVTGDVVNHAQRLVWTCRI